MFPRANRRAFFVTVMSTSPARAVRPRQPSKLDGQAPRPVRNGIGSEAGRAGPGSPLMLAQVARAAAAIISSGNEVASRTRLSSARNCRNSLETCARTSTDAIGKNEIDSAGVHRRRDGKPSLDQRGIDEDQNSLAGRERYDDVAAESGARRRAAMARANNGRPAPRRARPPNRGAITLVRPPPGGLIADPVHRLKTFGRSRQQKAVAVYSSP